MTAPEPSDPPDHTYRDGVRAGLPLLLPTFAIALTFGVLAGPLFGAAAAIAMSALVFAGSAQFAAVAVVGAGGGVVPAVASGLLLNTRFLPMGFAVAPYLPGSPAARAVKAQALVDASWALAHTGGGRYDHRLLIGATLPQYAVWLLGTATGVFGGTFIGDPARFGLDVVFPAFYLALLVGELKGGRRLAAALLAAALTLALMPFTPPGVPVVVASVASLIGLWRR